MKELAEKTGITQSFNRYMVECELLNARKTFWNEVKF